MKSAREIIAEMAQEQAEQDRLEALQDAQSEKMLTWLLEELDTPHVKATFGEPEFNLVSGVGPTSLSIGSSSFAG